METKNHVIPEKHHANIVSIYEMFIYIINILIWSHCVLKITNLRKNKLFIKYNPHMTNVIGDF